MIVVLDRTAHRVLLEEFLHRLCSSTRALDAMPAAVIRATAEDIATAWGEFVLNLTEAELRTGAAALLADPGFVAAAVQPSFVDAANLLQRHLSAEACAPQACAPESRNRLAEEFAARLARMKIARIGST